MWRLIYRLLYMTGEVDKVGDDKSSGYEPSVLGDPAEEAPVAGQDGEPLEEDRIAPKDPDEAVVNVDG